MNNDYYLRQIKLLRETLEKIKNTHDTNHLNLYLNDLYSLFNLLEDSEDFVEWHQQMMDNWGTLEIINAIMLAENKPEWSAEDETLRLEAISQLDKLISNACSLLTK